MDYETIDISQDEPRWRKRKTIYAYVARVAAREMRLIARPAHGAAVALVASFDLEKLKRVEELERLALRAQEDPEFCKALQEQGVPVEGLDALRELFRWAGVLDGNLGTEFLNIFRQSSDYCHAEMQTLLGRAERAARDAKLRAALEEAGVAFSWPTGGPGEEHDLPPLVSAGEPPVSEQIIAERR